MSTSQSETFRHEGKGGSRCPNGRLRNVGRSRHAQKKTRKFYNDNLLEELFSQTKFCVALEEQTPTRDQDEKTRGRRRRKRPQMQARKLSDPLKEEGRGNKLIQARKLSDSVKRECYLTNNCVSLSSSDIGFVVLACPENGISWKNVFSF